MSNPGSSVHGIPQASILEWVAISFSRGPFQLRDRTRSPALAGGLFTTAPPGKDFGSAEDQPVLSQDRQK